MSRLLNASCQDNHHLCLVPVSPSKASLPASPWPPQIYVLSLWTYRLYSRHVNGILHYVVPWVWLLSLSVMSSRLVLGRCSMHQSFVPFYGRMIPHRPWEDHVCVSIYHLKDESDVFKEKQGSWRPVGSLSAHGHGLVALVLRGIVATSHPCFQIQCISWTYLSSP